MKGEENHLDWAYVLLQRPTTGEKGIIFKCLKADNNKFYWTLRKILIFTSFWHLKQNSKRALWGKEVYD